MLTRSSTKNKETAMAKYLVIIKAIVRNDDDDRIIQEMTREKTLDCDPSELKVEITKKKDFLKKELMEIWKDFDASIDVVVTQVLSL